MDLLIRRRTVSLSAPAFADPDTRFDRSVPLWLLTASALLIFAPVLDGGTTHAAALVLRLGTLLIAALYVAQAVRRQTVTVPLVPVTPAVVGFLVLAAVWTVLSPYPAHSMQWLLVLGCNAVLFYALLALVNCWRHVVMLLMVSVAVGMAEGAVAAYQAFDGMTLRPAGTFFNPNFLAGYLAAIIAGITGYLLFVGSRVLVRRSIAVLAMAWIFVLALTAVVVRTGSRGGMLALAAGITVVLVLRYRSTAVLVLAAIAAALTVIPNPLHDRFMREHDRNPAAYARVEIWRGAMQQLMEQPLGSGLGLYQYVARRHAAEVRPGIARYGQSAQTAHNEYLQMAVELGWVAPALFVGGAAVVLLTARRLLSGRLRRRHRAIVIAAFAAMVVVLVHASIDSNLHEPPIAMLLIVAVVTILAMRRFAHPRVPVVRVVQLTSRWPVVICACVVLGVLGVSSVRVAAGWFAHEAAAEALRHHDFATAEQRELQAIAWDRGKSLYHSTLAAVNFERFKADGRPAAAHDALAELETAQALNPLDGRVAALRGHVASAMGAWRQAADAYAMAVRLEPFNAFHSLWLARAYERLGRLEEAEASVRHAIELEPNFLVARAWLVKRLLAIGQTVDAQREYGTMIKRSLEADGWVKTDYEQAMLAVDFPGLAAAIEKASHP